MPAFVYSARSRTGEKVEGTLEASDRRAVVAELERRGLIPVTIADKTATSTPEAVKPGFALTSRDGMGRMSMRELLVFTTELSDLLASGMTLGNALNCLANRKTGGARDKIVADLRNEILHGASLSEAMGKHPATFSKLYISMIQAAEAGSAMNEVLQRLVIHYERIQELKEKIIMALVYPAIVVVLGAATLIFSLLVVIPKFKVIFDQLNQTLPLPTRILIGGSSFLARYGWLLAIVIAGGVLLARRALRTEAGRMWWDGLLLKLPLVRGIIAASLYANFARTLGTLLANGVPVLQALAIVERTVGNALIADEIRKARDRVTDGTTISGPLAAGKVFPTILTDMLAIGEQTGDMTGALTHIARRYESELDRNIKIFTTALEPILIVIVAVLVGFVAISILMAVFNLTNGLNV
ncbi:MAG: type II secretion system F family protein [Kiritimatiellia bacterium]